MKTLPKLSFWQIWNMSFGFLGVQIGYSLQNGNASRILSGLGSHVDKLSLFWLAAPLAGLIIQPIIGLSSDKTWTRLGRRIPFILAGSLLATLSMFLMPNSGSFASLMPILAFGAIMLLFMDSSFNITMQPFRALVGDMINDEQRNRGYSIQSFLINTGAIIGSMLPFALTKIGVSNVNVEGQVAPSVVWSFYIGGSILLISVLITSITTKEYNPSDYEQYHNVSAEEKTHHSLLTIIKDIPTTMWQLSIVQFFSWFSLFLMWVYTTPGIAQNVWKTAPGDSGSANYNEAANWVGIIFAAYSLFGALFSLVMARIATKIGRRKVYMGALILGGMGLFSMIYIHNQYVLFLSMLGLGIAWASILAMPYAILSATLPGSRMGIFMGLFNATITIPQITAGLFGGIILTSFGGNAIMMLGVSGVSMVIAGFGVLFVKDKIAI